MFGRISSFKCVLALFLLSSQFSFATERQAERNKKSCLSCLSPTGHTREGVRTALDQAIKDNDPDAFRRTSHSLTKFIIRDVLGIGLKVCFFNLISSTTVVALQILGQPKSFYFDPDNLDPHTTYVVGLSTGIMIGGVIPSLAATAITTARDCYAGAKAIRHSLRAPKEE